MNERHADWDDLRVVLAVGRAGTLAGAGKLLGFSHPTVFRRIVRLERRLGVRLFERGRAGYKPTPSGEELIAVAEHLEGQVTAAESRVAGKDLRPTGTIRVTTTDTLLIGLLSPIFARFLAAHPGITLEVVVSNQIFDLSKRDADVAIRPSKEVPGDLVGRRIADIYSAVYRHVDFIIPGAALAGLASLPWVGLDGSLSFVPMARWMRRNRMDGAVIYRTNTVLGCLDGVRGGIGLGVLPCYLGDAQPDLLRVGPPIEELTSELWLLTHADLRGVLRVRMFVDFMADALEPHRGRFAQAPVASS